MAHKEQVFIWIKPQGLYSTCNYILHRLLFPIFCYMLYIIVGGIASSFMHAKYYAHIQPSKTPKIKCVQAHVRLSFPAHVSIEIVSKVLVYLFYEWPHKWIVFWESFSDIYSSYISLFFEKVFPLEPGGFWLSCSGWSSCPRDPPTFASTLLGLQACPVYLAFPWGPYVCEGWIIWEFLKKILDPSKVVQSDQWPVGQPNADRRHRYSVNS